MSELEERPWSQAEMVAEVRQVLSRASGVNYRITSTPIEVVVSITQSSNDDVFVRLALGLELFFININDQWRTVSSERFSQDQRELIHELLQVALDYFGGKYDCVVKRGVTGRYDALLFRAETTEYLLKPRGEVGHKCQIPGEHGEAVHVPWARPNAGGFGFRP